MLPVKLPVCDIYGTLSLTMWCFYLLVIFFAPETHSLINHITTQKKKKILAHKAVSAFKNKQYMTILAKII